jgi:hypothetical protein
MRTVSVIGNGILVGIGTGPESTVWKATLETDMF